MLLTGDLANAQEPAVYQDLARLYLQGCSCPVYWLPGNHDLPEWMQSQAQSLGLSPEKTFVARGVRLILLDSVEPKRQESHGWLSQAELSFLADTLRRSKEEAVVVALHHPPLCVGCDWMDALRLQNEEDFREIIFRYPAVRAVLFGHVHTEIDQSEKGIRFLATPSTAYQFKIAPEFAFDELPPGYRRLWIEATGKLRTEVVRV
ncbi:MAG: phosphodiesterase [Microscillaceae bacterium]|nr:phosphodiesterase [Microscillaceae bacterium]